MHRAVVEGGLHRLVLVGDARVGHVDEPVGRAGEEQVRGRRVEGELGDVVGVDFVVLGFRGLGRAEVPGVLLSLSVSRGSSIIYINMSGELEREGWRTR